jgi:hypothetical protein
MLGKGARIMTTVSERATAAIQPPRPKVHRVCCPNCEATFDLNRIGKPRSPEQHRRFWKIMQLAFLGCRIWVEDGERGGWAWTAINDWEAPKCWTDGVCWASNEDGVPSKQPRHWRYR